MTNHALTFGIKYLAKDLIGDFLYWPIWWYSKGLLNTILFSFHSIRDQQEALGVSIWIKNIFTPMYGQTDWEGRIISFFMRLIQIIIRGAILIIWSVVLTLPIILWVLLPLVIISQVYLNLIDLLN